MPEEPYTLPIGKANVIREGDGLTIVAHGRMLHEATKAADILEGEGVSVEVIDPLWLQPLDTETIINSVLKTHNALVVHEAVRFGGLGAEIAAQIAELAFDSLDAPVGRVAAPFSPVPFSPVLEQTYVPNAERIAAEARRILGMG